MKHIIEGKEFQTLPDILTYYGYTYNEYRNEKNKGGDLYSLLSLSGLAEENLNKEDIEYLKGLTLDKYKRDHIYKILPENIRLKIKRRHNKGLNAFVIATQLDLKYELVKEYLTLNLAKTIDYGYKICISCRKELSLNKFWKSKGKPGARCSNCLNKERRDRRANDPEYRKAIAKTKKKSYEKAKKQEINTNGYSYRTRTEERKEYIRKKKKEYYNKKINKELQDKIIKTRLLFDKDS